MRKSVVAAWLALSSIFAAVPAAADSPISLPPLAPGEVLLEVGAVGVATSPATSATLNVTISSQGETEEEARRGADAALARVAAAARAAGIAEADVVVVPVTVGSLNADIYGNSMDMDAMNAMGALTSYGSASAVIRIRNPAAAGPLRRTLGGLENVSAAEPEYRLDDDSTARRSARTDAVRRARADAEGYAASMNMRVVRVLRVTERAGTDFMSMLVGENALMRDFERGRSDQDGRIRTYAIVGVDYALAPR